MNPRIILSPDAQADLDSAARWYRRVNIDLSRRFRAEVAATLLRVMRHPNSFVCVKSVTRRALMTRFPYSIYFTFHANCVLVQRIRHQRRGDALWSQSRPDWQADDD